MKRPVMLIFIDAYAVLQLYVRKMFKILHINLKNNKFLIFLIYELIEKFRNT